jgi:DNA-binding CsgD family transcriptional regulator
MAVKRSEAEEKGEWQSALAELIACDDVSTLWTDIFVAISKYLDISSLSLIGYQPDKLPVVCFSIANEDPSRRRISAYEQGAYLLDPFYRACMEHRVTGICQLSEIAPRDFETSQYFRTFFSTYGLFDEVNIIVWEADNTALALSLGRPKGERQFGPTALARIGDQEPLLSAIVRKTWRRHFSLSATADSSASAGFHRRLKAALDNFGTSVLTPREKEVLDHLLRGYSVKSAAANLGVTAGTVRIHRHSIYEKLDIGSQTELFALILECLRQTTDNFSEDPLSRMLPPNY